MTEEEQGGTAPQPEATASAADEAPEQTAAAVAVADEPAETDETETPSGSAETDTTDTTDVAAATDVDVNGTAPEAVAVSGLQRNTLSSRVPERPGKLRGTVRRLLRPEAGACPMPMQPLQPAWCSRAPAWTRSFNSPSAIRFSRSWRELGLTSKDTRSTASMSYAPWRKATERS